MAIYEEQMLEPFVARGIGTSGVASRQIQASNLPDLRSALATSEATRRNLLDAQRYQLLSQMKAPATGVRRGQAARPEIPFRSVLKREPSGEFTLSYLTDSMTHAREKFVDLSSLKRFIRENPYLRAGQTALLASGNVPQEFLKAFPNLNKQEFAEVQGPVLGMEKGGSLSDIKFADPTYKARTEKQQLEEEQLKARNEMAKKLDWINMRGLSNTPRITFAPNANTPIG